MAVLGMPSSSFCVLCIAVAAFAVGVSAASPPSAPCTWSSGAFSYDLSPLYTGVDYRATDGSYDYVMSVCNAATRQQGCGDKGYSVCQFDPSSGTFLSSLGSFAVSPVWNFITIGSSKPPEPGENGVMYTFTNGDICWIAGRQQIRTVNVIFRCDEYASPMTIEEDQTTCEFFITLKTPHACQSNPIVSSTYTDSRTKSKWDLSPLHRDAGDFVGSWGDFNYSMNIGDLTTMPGPCRSLGQSICQYTYSGNFVAGLGGIQLKPPGQWQLIDADPSVGIRQIYRNGEQCWVAGRMIERTSIISFYCDPHGPREFSVTEDYSICTFYFKFSVAEGCPSRA